MTEERCPCGAKPLGMAGERFLCEACWPVPLTPLYPAPPAVVPGLRYRCGCPALRSDKIKAFCDTHLVGLERDP